MYVRPELRISVENSIKKLKSGKIEIWGRRWGKESKETGNWTKIRMGSNADESDCEIESDYFPTEPDCEHANAQPA